MIPEDTFMCDLCSKAAQVEDSRRGAMTTQTDRSNGGMTDEETTQGIPGVSEGIDPAKGDCETVPAKEERSIGGDEEDGGRATPGTRLEGSSSITEPDRVEDDQNVAASSEAGETEDYTYWECDYNTFIDIRSGPPEFDEMQDTPVVRHTYAHPLIRLQEKFEVVDPLQTPLYNYNLHDRVARLENSVSKGFQALSRQLESISASSTSQN